MHLIKIYSLLLHPVNGVIPFDFYPARRDPVFQAKEKQVLQKRGEGGTR
jgi:hypothetical protein